MKPRFPDLGRIARAAALCAALAWCAPAGATNTLSVMTFNLRYASAPDGADSWSNAVQSPQRREVAVRVITNRMPDLIGFQEAEDGQIAYVRTALPAHYAIQWQKPSGGGGNENAAFAWNTNRLTLEDRGVISLGPRPGPGYWNNAPGTNFEPWVLFPENSFAFPRLALWGRFRVNGDGREILFYATHFDTFNAANAATSQVKSAMLIADDALARNARMPSSPLAIAVGDFNGSQNDRAWKLFTGSLTNGGVTGDFADSWLQANGTWTNSGTFHGFAGGVIPEASRIDWILHRGGFAATQCLIVGDAYTATNLANGATRTQYPSDHYPVLARLALPPAPADYDRDGLPDAMELASSNALPADPDTDNDLLLDGQEDRNGNGIVDGGETDPGEPSAAQNPTDIREHMPDGIRDYRSAAVASNGLVLHARFDGRYLYVATQDAGEGSDHFIFVTRAPDQPTNAPWAKAGQVAKFDAFLADENDNDFKGWYDASRALITNLLVARPATYWTNGGMLDGVIDLGSLYGAGFTSPFFIAAAPFGTGDGGTNYAAAQVPAGNGDGNVLGSNEFFRIDPGDEDGDGVNDAADPDRDGLPDAWETAYFGATAQGADGDADGDGSRNADEWLACTRPDDSNSVFKISGFPLPGPPSTVSWPVVHGKTTTLRRASGALYSDALLWSNVSVHANASNFPMAVVSNAVPAGGTSFLRVEMTP